MRVKGTLREKHEELGVPHTLRRLLLTATRNPRGDGEFRGGLDEDKVGDVTRPD